MKMLLRKGFCFLALLAAPLVKAQWKDGLWIEKQAYNWCIPNNGINFNTGSPVTYTGVGLPVLEGSAAISSPTGELLFYAGGNEIYNKNFELMQNGGGLIGGNSSSTQSGVIVPKPGSQTIYYLINVDNGYTLSPGLTYSEIDMSLNGGLGAVTANKNIVLNANAKVEKITAVHHADGNKVWVVTHLIESNEYVAYLVSDAGISSTPITSAIGSFYTGLISDSPEEVSYGPESVGQLKFSPDGTKLAANIIDGPNKGVELFDFNNETGEITNYVHLGGFLYNPYGLEFSPNSKYLYSADSMGFVMTSTIRQFNTDAVDVQASEIVVFDNNPMQPFGSSAMQLAPDGRIYIKDVVEGNLTAILYPNNEGTACGVQPFNIALNPGGGIGLTSFIQSYFESGILAEQSCPGEDVAFTLLRIPNVSSVSWNFGDPESGADNISATGLHSFSSGGTYTITAEITSNGVIQVATAQITVPGPDGGAVTPQNLKQCAGDTEFNLTPQTAIILGNLDLTVYSVSYFTFLADAEGNVNAIADTSGFTSQGQTIFARVTNSETNCYTIVQFELEFFVPLQTVDVADLESCDVDAVDGIGLFNLSLQNNALIAGQADVTVKYYRTNADAEADVNAISDSNEFENTTSPQTIYARLVNSVTGCYAVTDFEIVVLDAPTVDAMYELRGCAPFDLTTLVIDNLDLSYYATEEDALSEVNAIENPKSYYGSGNHSTVYVRAQNEEGCAAVTELHLIVENCDIQRGISPNGDEFNENLDLTSFNVIQLRIYNRYGKEVYSKGNYTNQWHGQGNNGESLPTGTYYYQIELATENKTGWIYINDQR